MPNNVTNIITFSGDYGPLLENIRNGENLIDFNKIKPMPEEIRYVSTFNPIFTGTDDEYHKYMNHWTRGMNRNDRFHTQHKITQEMYDDYILNFGFANWYDWSLHNWGTKWNAYSQSLVERGIKFDTAWSAPVDLIRDLSKMYPEVTVYHKFADEDMGYNVGNLSYESGDIVYDQELVGGSPDAYKLYFELNPGYEDDYIDLDGEYYYINTQSRKEVINMLVKYYEKDETDLESMENNEIEKMIMEDMGEYYEIC